MAYNLYMSYEVVLALVLFAFVVSASPGPNNIMLITSAVNYGFVNSIPHILGVVIGFSFMCMCFAVGLGRLFQLYPSVLIYLKILACAYLVWLSWRIAFSKAVKRDETGKKSRPLSFYEAALFQWVNPKGLVMALSAVTLYAVPDHLVLSAVTIGLIFISVMIFCQTAWAAFGVALRTLLKDPQASTYIQHIYGCSDDSVNCSNNFFIAHG